MKAASFEANLMVTLLNAKLGDETRTFSVNPGNKYDKIVVTSYGRAAVHAFVDADGRVLKAAGWSAPAKGVRYHSVVEAVEHADPFGNYLYR